jgi:hypothetical protein
MDIVTGIATASKCLELVKAIRDVDKQLGEADLKARAAELLTNIADLKVALVEAQEFISEQSTEIKRLKDAFEFRGQLVEVGSFKYEKGLDGKPQGTAFCPRCEAKDGRYYRMT